MKAELKSLKNAEKGGFTASLWVDGKRIAKVSRDCDQLPRFEWLLERGLVIWNQLVAERGTSGQKLILSLADECERNRWLKRQCKTQTLFKVAGDGLRQWRSNKNTFSPIVKKALQREFGNMLEEIANERFP